MATITGLTAARMQEIIDKTIVDADIVGQHLILTLEDGSTIDAGAVGPAGKGTAFPAGATDGDLFVRTDQPGDPLYKYTDGAWQIFTGGGVSKGASFPVAPAPTDGDLFVRTDQVGDPMYKYTDGVWELQPRMGAVNVPACRVTDTSTVSVPTQTETVLPFVTEDYDTDTMHDNVSNTTRFTAKTPGIYLFEASFFWSTGGSGQYREAYFKKNGSTTFGLDDRSAITGSAGSPATWQGIKGVVRLAAGDYVEIATYQGSGGSVNVTNRHASATWLGGAGQTVDERGVPAFTAYNINDQSIPGGSVVTKLTIDGESYDTDSCFDPTLSRFVVKTPGIYDLKLFLPLEDNGATWVARLYKNGTRYKDALSIGDQSGTSNPYLETSWQIKAAAGDYFEVFVVNTAAATAYRVFGHAVNEFGRAEFSAAMIGSGKTVTPYARANNSTGPSIPNDTPTIVALPTETSDNDGIHDTVTNTSRLTCRTAGVYAIVGKLGFVANAVGIRRAVICVNGSTISGQGAQAVTVAGTATYAAAVEVVELAVGDYVELQAYQNSGGALALVNANIACELSMVKIGAPIAGNTGIEIVETKKPPILLNGFTNYDQPAASPLHYYKDRGRVYLGGYFSNPSSGLNAKAGGTLFVLPAGYRPSQYLSLLCNANNAMGVLRIDPDGSLWIASGNTSFGSLDGLSFPL